MVMLLTGSFLTGTAFAQPFTTITISTDGTTATVLIAEFGTDDIAGKFENDIKRMPKSVKVLRFNRDNLGGCMPHAWRIARLLRERRITTYVNDSHCASMCTLIFLGGVERIATSGASFMIHAGRGSGRDPAAASKVNAYVATQYIEHGFNKEVAEQIFITNESTRRDHHYSSREAQKIGLVTQIR